MAVRIRFFIGLWAGIFSFFISSSLQADQPLTSSQKIEIIFDYAVPCNWLSPDRCAARDPNFGDYTFVAPYRSLCQNKMPSQCLADLNLLPMEGPSPLALRDFDRLQGVVERSIALCGSNYLAEFGYSGCMLADGRNRSTDRRLWRYLYGGDPVGGDYSTYTYVVEDLGMYRGLCFNQKPYECLMHFAPVRPSPELQVYSPPAVLTPFEPATPTAPGASGSSPEGGTGGDSSPGAIPGDSTSASAFPGADPNNNRTLTASEETPTFAPEPGREPRGSESSEKVLRGGARCSMVRDASAHISFDGLGIIFFIIGLTLLRRRPHPIRTPGIRLPSVAD